MFLIYPLPCPPPPSGTKMRYIDTMLISLNKPTFIQVKLATDAGLIIFCWGDDIVNKSVVKKLKDMGLHAVIYDKLDQYTTKDVKVMHLLI